MDRERIREELMDQMRATGDGIKDLMLLIEATRQRIGALWNMPLKDDVLIRATDNLLDDLTGKIQGLTNCQFFFEETAKKAPAPAEMPDRPSRLESSYHVTVDPQDLPHWRTPLIRKG